MKKFALYVLVFLLPVIGCQRLDEVPFNIPTVTTLGADEIGVASATIHGKVEGMNAIYCYYYFLVSEDRNFPKDNRLEYFFETGEPKEEQGLYAEVTGLHENVTYYYILCATDGTAEVRGEVCAFMTAKAPEVEVFTGNPFSSSVGGDYQLIGYASVCPADFSDSSCSAYFICKTDGEETRKVEVGDYAFYYNEDYGLWEFGGWSSKFSLGKLYEYRFCISMDGEEYSGETKTIWTDPVVETLVASKTMAASTQTGLAFPFPLTIFHARVSKGYNAYMYISRDRSVVSAGYNLENACKSGKAVKISLVEDTASDDSGDTYRFSGYAYETDGTILGSSSSGYYYRAYAEAPVSYPNYFGEFFWRPCEYGDIREIENIFFLK